MSSPKNLIDLANYKKKRQTERKFAGTRKPLSLSYITEWDDGTSEELGKKITFLTKQIEKVESMLRKAKQ